MFVSNKPALILGMVIPYKSLRFFEIADIPIGTSYYHVYVEEEFDPEFDQINVGEAKLQIKKLNKNGF